MVAMTNPDLARRRLVAQRLVGEPFVDAVAAVRAFGAMQGQDLAGVLASAALRTPDRGLAPVIAALDAGQLVRGYPMRGTVFLVAAEDLAWLTDLMAAPALQASARRRPQLGLDDSHLEVAAEVGETALTGGRGASRAELFAAWQQAGVPTDQGRGYHLLSALTHAGLTCYGPWNGADQNVVLASRWLPAGSSLADRFGGDVVAATADLLGRYLSSHGPATLRDFAWWTKLPLRTVRAALPLVDGLEGDGEPEASYWRAGLADEVAAAGASVDGVLLLPGFDEFILGYPDRLFAMTEACHAALVPGNNGVFRRAIVSNAQVVGYWTAAKRGPKRVLATELFVRETKKLRSGVEREFAAHPLVGDFES